MFFVFVDRPLVFVFVDRPLVFVFVLRPLVFVFVDRPPDHRHVYSSKQFLSKRPDFLALSLPSSDTNNQNYCHLNHQVNESIIFVMLGHNYTAGNFLRFSLRPRHYCFNSTQSDKANITGTKQTTTKTNKQQNKQTNNKINKQTTQVNK